jgi:hypothetical protein
MRPNEIKDLLLPRCQCFHTVYVYSQLAPAATGTDVSGLPPWQGEDLEGVFFADTISTPLLK